MNRAASETAQVVEESYEDLYEHAPCGLLSTDELGAIVEANATFCTWTGYPAEYLAGRTFSQLLAMGSQLFWDTRCLPVLRLEGQVHEVAVNLVCKDRTTLPVLVNCCLRDVPGTDARRIRIAVVNVTQRIDYERELLSARRVAERSAARVEVLQQASSTFEGATSVTAVADGLAEIARRATDAGSAAVLFAGPGPRERRLASSASHPFGDAVTDEQDGPETDAMRRREVVTVSGIDALQQAYPARADAWHAARVASVTAVPLLGCEESMGVLLCGFGRPRELGDDDLELLRALARQAVQALQRIHLQEQLRHQAMHDRLTGLANRAQLQERLEQALAVADRSRRPLALVFLDLDGFKQINDRRGHATGDAVLVEVAARLRAVTRAADTVARFGGDEFVVLCEDATSATVQALADRIRSVVTDTLTGPAAGCSVSASIGVATHAPGGGTSVDADVMLRTADTAMYVAKRGGKNGVRLASV